MKVSRVILAAVLVAALAASASAQLGFERMLPAFTGATAWLNSAPLTPADLRGKVVLVNFWNLTCINWLRQVPYVRAWAEKYKDQGLVVVGVHAPEFEFEKNLDDVKRHAMERRIDYPIVADNNHAIWRAFANRAWPALYFADAQGRIRQSHLGEGEYEKSERTLQMLLAEAGTGRGERGLVAVDPRGVEVQADWGNLRSAETYLGYARAEGFAANEGVRRDAPMLYRGVASPPLNGWGLMGTWTVGPEFAALNEGAGRITMRFRARDLHLVLAPAMAGRAVRFRVTLDGKPPGEHHGVDVDAEGLGIVRDGRMFQLIRQSGMIGERLFEIEFLDPGVRAYAFTFG